MALDAFKNFAISSLTAGITAGAVSLSVTAGEGTKFPAVSFNATIWDSTTFGSAYLDPDAEIVRVTAIAVDTFTITRGQEGTTAVAHNTGGSTYKILAGVSALNMNKALDKTGDTMTGSLALSAGNLSVAAGTITSSGNISASAGSIIATGGSALSNRRVGGGISGIQTTSVTLTVSSPQNQIWNPGAGQTCTLPVANTLQPGEGFDWVNFSANSLSIARQGADTLTFTTTTGATSTTVATGGRLSLRTDGVSIWYRTG